MDAKQQKIVDWLQSLVDRKCGYIMGATGQVCTLAFRQQQAKQYASYDGNARYGQETIMGIGAKWDGKPVYDCQGLTRRAYEQIGISLRSGATTQYNEAKKTYVYVKPISEMPTGGIAGAQLWRKSKSNAAVMSHTAICIGGGKLVEAAGTREGVKINNNIGGYAFYGVPQGLLDDRPIEIDNGLIVPPDPDRPSAGNDYTVARTVAGGVNMRQTPGGKYMLKIPEHTDIEVTAYTDDCAFGMVTFAAPTGRYAGELYTGWIDLQFVEFSGGEGEALQSDTAESIVWSFLKSKGLCDNAIAGIMGNLQAESGMLANNLQNTGNKALGMDDVTYTVKVDTGTYDSTSFINDRYGYGIAQWTHPSRKQALLAYCKERRTSIGDIRMQLEFMWMEMASYKTVMQVITGHGVTLKQASDVFMTSYEKPANQSEDNKLKRAAYGQAIYDRHVRGDW